MADERERALCLYMYYKSKRRNYELLQRNYKGVNKICRLFMKRRRLELLQAIMVFTNPIRSRDLWSRRRSFAWFEMVESTFDDTLWYENFRVTKGTFEYILTVVKDDISRKDTIMRTAVTPNHRLALTMYYLSSTAEYRTIGNLFGVSTSFVCLCVRDVCKAIQKRLLNVINFPKRVNLVNVIKGYQDRWGFPMCAGAIDGTHIPIIAPKENAIDYVNRKKFHSIIMQAVVDYNYLFRDIVIGWPGSVHDARVLANSEIFKRANNNSLFSEVVTRKLGDQEVRPIIIGDPAYPLLPWLMKPFPDKGNSSESEQVFNYRLSRTRMTVENTFGRWKGRFRRFTKRVDMEVCNVITIVAASCVLHNICECQGNEFLPEWEVAEPETNCVQGMNNNQTIVGDGENLRGALAQYFMSQRGR